MTIGNHTLLAIALLLAWAIASPRTGHAAAGASATGKEDSMSGQSQTQAVATLAGGCFWCVEADLEKLPGVSAVISGYTGGNEQNPTYEQVSSGTTGHYEAVQVHFDPKRVTYRQVLDVFLRHIDPTDPGGQFADRGRQYRTAIFVHDAAQKEEAARALAALDASGRFTRPIVTEILPFAEFTEAEPYHQDYWRTHKLQYQTYRNFSGRDQFLTETWGDAAKAADAPAPAASWQQFTRPDDAALRKQLTPLAFEVTRENGTERPFDNAYWDNKAPGLYVDVVSGEPLFGSRDKYDSGTGWPSFTRPIRPDAVVEHDDVGFFSRRTEVRSRLADSHLGHVFPDGPPPANRRYCMNSAALRFIPADAMVQAGYGDYLNDIK